MQPRKQLLKRPVLTTPRKGTQRQEAMKYRKPRNNAERAQAEGMELGDWLAKEKTERHNRHYLLKQHLVGRPQEYLHPHHDEYVLDLRMVGLTSAQIAKMLRISVELLYTWLEEHPSFYDAWCRGGEEADAQVARKLFARATGYSHAAEKIAFDRDGETLRADYTEHYAPDTAAAIFWLTNRQPQAWKSRQSTELTGADGQPLAPPQVNIVGIRAKPTPVAEGEG